MNVDILPLVSTLRENEFTEIQHDLSKIFNAYIESENVSSRIW